MKMIALFALTVFLMASGVTLAQQSAPPNKDSSMQGMMQGMMKNEKDGEHSRGMMRMMKMMDQCAAMMESTGDSEASKESQKK